MANEEHLKILRQGVEVWNQWLKDNKDIRPELNRADLREADLSEAYLSEADLSEANLSETNLHMADLSDANLHMADLREANLSRACLIGADLSRAYFIGANLSRANLHVADLREANLSDANLREANLSDANLREAKFENANFEKVRLMLTYLVGVDLRSAKNLESAQHDGYSYLDNQTLIRSQGEIPEEFLRGCGLSDWQIEQAKLYNPNLSNEEINNIQYRIHDLRVKQAFQINPLFISYSHNNSDFVDAIEKKLLENGVRFWRDIHHAKAGRLEKQIDAAIHLNDVVLVVLSEHSTNSDWVEHEARKARAKEKTGKDALCPVALDDSWKTCRWPARLREQIMEYNILDFSNWQDELTFQRQFTKLLEGLNLFYK